ncbi:MAG: type II secretion system protein [Phycisphaerales bacterium]|nr:type II secretion system protein [Phycisphaerales bacterium]
MRPTPRAFTLVEILIVVVILGILAAIVIPSFARATSDAAENVTLNELSKLRRHVGIFQARNGDRLPNVVQGNGTWGELVGPDHFLAPPTNPWVGGGTQRVITFGNAPDGGYQSLYGWIYDPATGDVWAGGFDGNDLPYPRN